jgi:ankyrin repeat protein
MNTSQLIAQAAAAGDIETVRNLLEVDPVLVHSHTRDGWTPLHLATHFGHGQVAEALLACGADVHVRATNDLGTTPLLWAVMGQDVVAVTLLLDHGADVNVTTTAGSTPLHKAAVLGNVALVRLLLARGAYVNARNSGGQTPLTHALFKGHTEVVALLQEYKGSE